MILILRKKTLYSISVSYSFVIFESVSAYFANDGSRSMSTLLRTVRLASTLDCLGIMGTSVSLMTDLVFVVCCHLFLLFGDPIYEPQTLD